jgi:hypothetical protein
MFNFSIKAKFSIDSDVIMLAKYGKV